MTTISPIMEAHTNCGLPCCENIGLLFDVAKAMEQATVERLRTKIGTDAISNKFSDYDMKTPLGKKKVDCWSDKNMDNIKQVVYKAVE